MANKGSNAGEKRLYKTLCKVLDALRSEAPKGQVIYHPPASNVDGIIQARSRALLHLFLKARFGLATHKERESHITDGPHDGGIDAYFIDKERKRILLLQSKFRANADNFSSTKMSASDFLKMDVSRILKGETKSEQGHLYNSQIKRMQKEIGKIPDRGSYIAKVIVLGNADNFSAPSLKRLVEGYEVEQIPHSVAYKDLLFPVVNGTYFTSPDLTIEIHLDNLRSGNAMLDYDVKTSVLNANVKVLFVPTREVGRIMNTYKNSILKFNPRSFLELQKNAVNKEIESSLVNGKGNEFAMFNNGITLISDKTAYGSDTGTKGRAQVVVTNPQLVNGGQTAYTLGRIFERSSRQDDFAKFKGKEVLLKVVTFVSTKSGAADDARRKLIGDISKASNSQTQIEESDRRSNDQIQLALQERFFTDHGLYYERKRGEFSDGLHDKYIDEVDVINREKLVRISLAGAYRVNQAKAGIKKFFKEPAFSNLFKVSDVHRYAYGYEVSRLLDGVKRSKSPGDRWKTKKFGGALRYGDYAVISACMNHGMKASKSPQEALTLVLSQWKDFEKKVKAKRANSVYVTGGTLDGVNYYKGSTLNSDVELYKFKL